MGVTKKAHAEPVEPVIDYHISRKKYLLIVIPVKLFHFGVGTGLAYFLYKNCMFTSCNQFVTVFFAILALGFFIAAGIPIEKLLGGGIHFGS